MRPRQQPGHMAPSVNIADAGLVGGCRNTVRAHEGRASSERAWTDRNGAIYAGLYEAGWPCQVEMCPSLYLGSVCSRSMGRGLGSREVRSALYSRSSKARGTRRRMRGFEGWGRHLRSGPAMAAKPTFALTHPSNLRETIR